MIETAIFTRVNKALFYLSALYLVIPMTHSEENSHPIKIDPIKTESIPVIEPKGFLYRNFYGSELEASTGIIIHGHLQGGKIFNNKGSSDIFPQGFYNQEEGGRLNQLYLSVERSLSTVIQPITGPQYGFKDEFFTFGFKLSALYGSDASAFVTYGLDDDIEINNEEDLQLVFPEIYAEINAPWFEGTSLYIGSFLSPFGYEKHYPDLSKNSFYTKSYQLQFSPIKHVGVLVASRISTGNNADASLTGIEWGIVNGWNNFEDNNNDPSLLLSYRWRSANLKTSFDLEAIIGDQQSEGNVSDQRPFTAVSNNNQSLQGYALSAHTTLTLNSKTRGTFSALYGYQEGGNVISDRNNAPGFLIVDDSEWYGIVTQLNYIYRKPVHVNARAELFRDADGAHYLFPKTTIAALTANIIWSLDDFTTLRVEGRYDRALSIDADERSSFPNSSSSSGLFSLGNSEDQFLISFDLTFQF